MQINSLEESVDLWLCGLVGQWVFIEVVERFIIILKSVGYVFRVDKGGIRLVVFNVCDIGSCLLFLSSEARSLLALLFWE